MRDLGGDALAIQTAGAEINDGVWHHNVMARDTLTHMDAYEDGAWIGEDTNGAMGNVRTYDGSAVPTFGKHASSSTLYFKGQIAEVRLTFNEARDADWVAATYYTLMDELIYVSTPVIYNNWPKGWTNRRAFVIPGTNIDDTLTDFPITLHLSSSSGTGTEDITDIFDEVGENYKRLAVADARGRLLPTEVELWDATAENGILHVKVPRIDSDYGAILFLYFNDNQPDQGWTDVVQSGLSPRVWSNGYGAVYHLNNDPTGGSGCILDSATLDDDDSGTPYGSMTAGDLLDDKAGGIGQSLDLDANDWILLTDNADIGGITGDITIEALAHRASVSGNNTGIVTKYDSSNDTGWVLGHMETGELAFSGRAKGGSYYNSGNTVNTYDDDNWFYAAGRRDASTWKIWGNAGAANDIASATGGSGDISGGSVEARIGCTYVGSNMNFFGSNGSGHVGEIRISSVARSDAFLKATYYTLFDDLGEWGVAEAEPAGGEIEIELTNPSLEITVHSLSTELSMTLYLGTPRVEITPHALSTSYIGNIVKMIGVDASRPRIADASSKRAGIAKATGSHPGLAAAEAFEYQERE
jgi:hypothetical protein